jgi:hypothetical protein
MIAIGSMPIELLKQWLVLRKGINDRPGVYRILTVCLLVAVRLRINIPTVFVGLELQSSKPILL